MNSEYCNYLAFCTIMAILRQKKARSRNYALLLFQMTSRVLYSAQYHRQHSMPLLSLEHCICTTTMTNIRPDRDSNLSYLGYKPQSIRISHRGRAMIYMKPYHMTTCWSWDTFTLIASIDILTHN